MTEGKTIVFGNDSSANALIPALMNGNMNAATMAAMNNGGFGGNAWWPMMFLFALWGNNGWGNNGNRGTETILQTLNGDQGRDMLMSAINGNGNAIAQLASTVGCDINAVQAALNAIQGSICQLGNTVGLSGQQIINAIQAGDNNLASKLAECCCENRLLTTQQGYENRISLQEQTNFLGAKIDYQTQVITDKFCDLEKRELQNKIDNLREQNSTLMGQISNANQTAAIQSYVANLVNPLISDVASIKAAQPATVTVPANNGVFVPSCVAAQAGYFPFLNNNGSIWS